MATATILNETNQQQDGTQFPIWCPVFHLHQPPYDGQTISRYHECVERSYRHHLDVLERHPRIKVNFNITGVLLEQMKEYDPELVERFRNGVERGQIYLTSTLYSHGIAPKIARLSEAALRLQIERDLELKMEMFKVRPEVLRPPEYAVDEETIRIAGDYFNYILIDGQTLTDAGIPEHHAVRKNGVTLISRDRDASDFLGFFKWVRDNPYNPNWDAIKSFSNGIRYNHRILTDCDGEAMIHWMLKHGIPVETAQRSLDEIYTVVETDDITTVHLPAFARSLPPANTENHIPPSSYQGGLYTWEGKDEHNGMWMDITDTWSLYLEAKARNITPAILARMEQNALRVQTSCFMWYSDEEWFRQQPPKYKEDNKKLLQEAQQ